MLKPELLLNDLNPLNLEDSRYEYKNKGVPSVTELLSYIDNQGLINWANMIGRKGMNNQDVLKRAAQFGTNTHSAIEKYLKNQDIFVDNSSFKAFINWWDKLNEENKVDIIGQEESLISPYYAGTYDLLVNINGDPYLVDFKTSNHVGYKYFMQIAAYRYLLYTQKNINIQGSIVLQLKKGVNPKYNEFVLNFNNPFHYEFIENSLRAFMGIVYTFHNAENCKKQFNDIFD
jgi:hypothetical protein